MPTRNQHAHAHGACNTRGCKPAAAPPHNAHAQTRAPFSRDASRANPAAANSPRAPQTQRTPFGPHANSPARTATTPARPTTPAHAATSARTITPARATTPTQPPTPAAQAPRIGPNAGARTQTPSPAHGAAAQRRAAVQSPGRGSFAVQPPAPLGGGAQQIKVTVAGSRKVAGSVEIRPANGGKAFISDLVVERDFRRKGLANQLMDAALRSARGQGFSAAQLEARPSDNGISPQALVSMYRRMGFRSVGKSRRGNPLMERRL